MRSDWREYCQAKGFLDIKDDALLIEGLRKAGYTLKTVPHRGVVYVVELERR